MLESNIENKVRLYGIARGWKSYKFVSPQQRGVPDRIFIRKGKVLFIEFKKKGEKPNDLQEYKIKELLEEGMDVRVIDNIEDGYHLFNTMELGY